MMTHPNIEFVIASAHEYVKRNEVKYGHKLSYSDKALMVKNLLDHIAALSASPPEQPAMPAGWKRESVREIAHRHCTCTCRGDPEVLQNHTNLCDEISDAILEYAVLSSAPQRPSTSAMHDLICAIIEDDAKYDAATNTWDTSKAATAIIVAFDGEPTTQSNIGR